jgi:hypothetical protein
MQNANYHFFNGIKKGYFCNMKRILNIVIPSIMVLVFTGCEKPVNKVVNPAYAEIEKIIRNEYDMYAVFTWNQYIQLLNKLKQDKFIVLPLNEMQNTFNASKVVVGLRHDIDFNPFKALEMSNMEKSYGIRSTYFILATSEYYGHFSTTGVIRNNGMEQLYKELFNNGAEIGIHNDLLTVMITHKIDPFEFNKKELSFYSSLNIPVHGTAAHGSALARATLSNFNMFSDFATKDSVEYNGRKYPLGEHSLKEYGFEYEAYFINFSAYYSDSGGKWNDPEGFTGILNKLDNSKPGDRIEILAHPDWWGMK